MVTHFLGSSDQILLDAIQTDQAKWNPTEGVCLKCLDRNHQLFKVQELKGIVWHKVLEEKNQLPEGRVMTVTAGHKDLSLSHKA